MLKGWLDTFLSWRGHSNLSADVALGACNVGFIIRNFVLVGNARAG